MINEKRLSVVKLLGLDKVYNKSLVGRKVNITGGKHYLDVGVIVDDSKLEAKGYVTVAIRGYAVRHVKVDITHVKMIKENMTFESFVMVKEYKLQNILE